DRRCGSPADELHGRLRDRARPDSLRERREDVRGRRDAGRPRRWARTGDLGRDGIDPPAAAGRRRVAVAGRVGGGHLDRV
ncbi:MAG: hypothetical protein AVDCRST_MAG45-1025, partial [uncultured Solirubrobacterales bacterium]